MIPTRRKCARLNWTRQDAYAKKSEESNGVLQMMYTLAADLDKDEKIPKDASEKRIADSKTVADKDAAKAESEVEIRRLDQELAQGL